MKKISLIPYVCGAGASLPGSEQGALYAHAHGLSEKLKAQGINANWAFDPEVHWKSQYGEPAYKNLGGQGSGKRLEIVNWHLRGLAENVATELRRGHRVITFGGDHTLNAGSMAGVQAAFGPDTRLGLIWIDAHPDIHTFKSSASKALHGMPLSTLTGLDDTLAIGAIDGEFAVKLKPEDIVFAGLRDIDEGERENARLLGIDLPTMGTVRAKGIPEYFKKELSRLDECSQIVLSIDLDAFSTELAPAVGSPVPEGFILEEILPILSKIVKEYPIALIDIVEFNPTLPGAEKTFDLLVRILSELMLE